MGKSDGTVKTPSEVFAEFVEKWGLEISVNMLREVGLSERGITDLIVDWILSS